MTATAVRAADQLSIGIPIGVLVLGVLVLVVGVVAFRASGRLRRAARTVPAGWLPATGQVVDENFTMDSTSSTTSGSTSFSRTPIVRFATPDGQQHTFTSGFSGSGMPLIGRHVGVYYDPSDPDRARIAPESIARANTVAAGCGGALVLVIASVIGLVLIAVGAVLFLLR